AGTDSFFGGDGDDTIISGGGDDTLDGGNGFDTILLDGTPGNDNVIAIQTDASHLSYTLNTSSQTFTFTTLEAAAINGLAGDDFIFVSVADALEATPNASLRFDVDGGPPNASDRLVVNDAGIGDLTILRQGPDGRSGSATV